VFTPTKGSGQTASCKIPSGCGGVERLAVIWDEGVNTVA
jgi:hypothetical protein